MERIGIVSGLNTALVDACGDIYMMTKRMTPNQTYPARLTQPVSKPKQIPLPPYSCMERCQSEGAELQLCAPGTLGIQCIAQHSATELAAEQR